MQIAQLYTLDFAVGQGGGAYSAQQLSASQNELAKVLGPSWDFPTPQKYMGFLTEMPTPIIFSDLENVIDRLLVLPELWKLDSE